MSNQQRRKTYPALSEDSIKKIAREYGRGKGPRELGKELGISRQRVQQIASNLRKNYGVNIPRLRSRTWKYEEIISELREESPELFEEK